MRRQISLLTHFLILTAMASAGGLLGLLGAIWVDQPAAPRQALASKSSQMVYNNPAAAEPRIGNGQ